MTTETIKSRRHGAIEHAVVRKVFSPYKIGHLIHRHTHIGRYHIMLNWDWMGEDEHGIGWFGEYWGHRRNGGQLRRRASMETAIKAIREYVGEEDVIGIEPERDDRGTMTGKIIVTKKETLDWGVLAPWFSI